jgi:hypothetical protein
LKGSVRIAGVTLTNLEIYFMDGGRPNIGLPVLRRIKVTYDHGNARSWTRSDATIDMSQPTKAWREIPPRGARRSRQSSTQRNDDGIAATSRTGTRPKRRGGIQGDNEAEFYHDECECVAERGGNEV